MALRGSHILPAGLVLGTSLSACVSDTQADVGQAPFAPAYEGVETRRLDDALVSVVVQMQGARGPQDVEDYAECAAAQYTLIRGYGFARHVRTHVQNDDAVWTADAVYTISPALPSGVQKIDAEVVVENCRQQGIPTV